MIIWLKVELKYLEQWPQQKDNQSAAKAYEIFYS
jgi:hypothetical protein